MLNIQPNQSLNIDQRDIIVFKNILIIFLLSRILTIVVQIGVDPYIASIINWVGTIVIAYGIFTISKKYSIFSSGNRAVVFFLLATIIDIGSTLLDFIITLPTPSSASTSSEAIKVLEQYANYVLMLALFSLIEGIAILLASYYFTDWFNKIFGKFHQSKGYFYFGIISLVANFALAFSFFQFYGIIKSIIANPAIAQSPTLFDNFNNDIIFAGLLLLGSFGTELVAILILQSRVNDLIPSKNPFFPGQGYYQNLNQIPYSYQQAYGQQPMYPPNPYQQPNGQPPMNPPNPYQQPYGQPPMNPPNPYQQPYSQPPIYPTPNASNIAEKTPQDEENKSTPETDSERHCKVCGHILIHEASFCRYCGAKIN